MHVETIDRCPHELDEIARRVPQATFYHTRIWLDSLTSSFPAWRFRCLVARTGAETLGYLPFFVVDRGIARTCWSLPFGTYGGPVVADDDAVGEPLIKRFLDLRSESGVHEVGLVDFHNRTEDASLSCRQALTHILELEVGFETIWNERFEKSKRRQSRKAEREGITVTEAASTDEVKEYYRIYEKRSDEWNQSVKYPQSLFINLVEKGRGSVRLFLARVEGELLGGHLNFYFGDTVTAWNGVTTVDSRSAQASTLLYSKCIRHACESGFKRYNLGGSMGKKSLMAYKESLGGVPYSYRVLRWRSLAGKIAATVKRRLSRR
jgi:CelD/BcsL family acetyltransferase involved in cellulose biosynthesis